MILETRPTVRPLKKLALNPATLRILDRPTDEGVMAALPDTYFCTIACSAICSERAGCMSAVCSDWPDCPQSFGCATRQ